MLKQELLVFEADGMYLRSVSSILATEDLEARIVSREKFKKTRAAIFWAFKILPRR
jgi:hypothetical protein